MNRLNILLCILMLCIAKVSFANSPKNIKHTNITGRQFFISWITDVVGTGAIKYGTNPNNLDKIAYDERGEGVEDDVHHIKVTQGVSPNTSYYYDIISGGVTYDNGGSHYTITTGPEWIPPNVENPAYGTIIKSGAPVQNQSCIVYLRLQKKNTNNISAQKSMLVSDPEGMWATYLNSFSKSNLTGEFKYEVNSDYYLIIFAEGAGLGVGSMIIDIKDPPLHQPAPDLEIGPDTTPPYLYDPQPASNTTANVNTDVTLHLRDTGYGVDSNTILMKVNDTSVTPLIIGTPQDYYLVYDPPNPFDFGTLVKVNIYAKDLAPTPNVLNTTYTFTTTSDNGSPTIILRVPDKNATGVAIDTNITIYLQDTESGIATSTIVMKIEGEKVHPQISGNLPKDCIVTYNPLQNFKYSQEVDVYLEVKDNASNMIKEAYTFTTTVDEEKPKTSGHTPSKNATDVAIDTPILFNITDEGAGVASSTIVFKVNGASITTYSLNEIPNGYSLYYDPAVDFGYNQIVEVSLQVEDMAFVPNKLIESYTFTTTKDIIPPKVIYRSPDIRETQVPVDSNITVYICDDETGINKDSIVMFVNGENVTEKLVITGTKTEYLVNYDPQANFGYNQVINVLINSKDLANNSMPQDAYTFTTKLDDIKPYVTDHSPTKGATGVKIDTEIMFHLKDNESGIDKSTFILFVEGIDVSAQVIITGTKSDYNVFYNPNESFDYGQEVNIMIKITDFGSNTIEEIYSFTTEQDTIKPKTSDHNPAKGATEVERTTNILLIIRDDETGINSDTIIMKVNDIEVPIIKTPINPPKAYLLTYNPPDFDYNQVVKVYIEIKDKKDNVATETYTFTTVSDNKKPYTTEHQPYPGATDVPIDTNIVMSICDDESGVARESILLKINNATITTMTVFPTLNGFTLIYDSTKNFNYGEDVSVYIEARDKIGNLATQTYTFTTIHDNTPPYTSDYSPAPFATNVPLNTDVVLHIRDDGVGVDESSIAMKVNSTLVTPVIIPPEHNYTIIYRPPKNFDFNAVVTVIVDAMDLVGNIMPQVVYTFTTTLDNVPPYITDQIPVPESTQIAVDTNISLHIKDNGAGVNKNSIIMKVGGEKVTTLISGGKEDYTIFYNPTYDFEANKRIYVYIYAEDLATTPNILEEEYFFITIDTKQPYIIGHVPAPNSIDAQVDTDVTFHIKDDGMGVDVSTIKVIINGATITDNIEGTPTDFTFTYNPPVDFECNQTVWVTVYAEDFVGNTMEEVYKFFVSDTIPPYTTDHKPPPGAVGVSPESEIEFHIKDRGTGVNKDSIKLWINGNKIDALDITGGTFDYTVKYKPPQPFGFGEIVTVTIEASDLAIVPNSMPVECYTFTTKGDREPPVLLWVTGEDTTHLKVFFEDENPPMKDIDNFDFFINESKNPTKSIKVYSANIDVKNTKNVNLITDVLMKNVFYTLVVINVTDAAGNVICPPNNRCEFSLKDGNLEGIIEKEDKTKVEFLPNTFFEDISTIEIHTLSDVATITQEANNAANKDKEIKHLIPNTTRVFIARKPNGSETLPSEFRARSKITIPYPKSPSDQEERVFYRVYQLVNNCWILVPGEQEVDFINNTVSVTVPHFGIYRIAASTPQIPPGEIEVFPNPFKPSKNHSFIYFRKFSGAITIRIFNIAGELMRTLEVPAGTPQPYAWDVKDDDGDDLATGVYIYIITNSTGDKVTGKVSVIR
ncbi:MAG: Ig-like domain-containing protein [bacterium]